MLLLLVLVVIGLAIAKQFAGLLRSAVRRANRTDEVPALLSVEWRS